MSNTAAMSKTAAGAVDYVIVLNAGSGRHDADDAHTTIGNLLEAAAKTFELIRVDEPKRLPAIAGDAARRVSDYGGVLVACGGDGTINTIAAAALAEDVPLGILPQGTFNLFGRAHGISSNLDESVAVLLGSEPRPVQVGLVNGKVFLVNASLGLYPEVLADREAWKKRFGRRRIVALWSGILTLLREHRPLDISLFDGKNTVQLHTPTLVVGNNPLQFARVGIDESARVGRGELLAVSLHPIGKWKMVGLILRGALGKLGDDDDVEARAIERLTATPRRGNRRRTSKVAVDGEVLELEMPLVFEISRRPLRLVCAQTASADKDPG